MPRKAAALLTLALVSLAFAPAAHADKYDLRLSRLFEQEDELFVEDVTAEASLYKFRPA